MFRLYIGGVSSLVDSEKPAGDKAECAIYRRKTCISLMSRRLCVAGNVDFPPLTRSIQHNTINIMNVQQMSISPFHFHGRVGTLKPIWSTLMKPALPSS